MINEPKINFIISFFTFLISFVGGNFFPQFYTLIYQRYDWIFSVGMIISFVFAILSVIGMIKKKRNNPLTTIEIIVFVGSFAIVTIFIILGLFTLLLSSGLPPQD